MIKAYNSLTAKEKQQVLLCLLLFAAMVATISILFNVTRGADVDYFKERLLLSESRMNAMDKKIDDFRDRHDKQYESLKDKTIEINRKIEEQEKWIEYWKTLPQLPKPKR